MSAGWRRCLALLALSAGHLLLVAGGATEAAPLTEAQRRGKAIYQKGASDAAGPITALVGGGAVEVFAAAVPCAGCHGADGRGRDEGGITPADITWAELAKPYGHVHPTGRRHPPYTEPALTRTILDGLDPAGAPLGAAMPRYRMSAQALADLLAYLKVLGQDEEPGVSATAITLATILPAHGPLVPLGRAVEAGVRAYLDRVNAEGGVYGRRLALRVAGPEEAAQLVQGDIFALVAPLFAGDEERLASLVERAEVPAVGALTPLPSASARPGRYAFYLLPGIAEQARALVRFATARLASPRAAILYPERPELSPVVAAIDHQGRQAGWPAPFRLGYRGTLDAEAAVVRLRADATDVVIVLGGGADSRAFLAAAEREGWAPEVWIPGSLAGRDVVEAPPRQRQRLVLGYPVLPPDPRHPGAREYWELVAKHGLPAAHVAAQVSAVAAAKVLVEGLKRAGRALRREGLVRALEGLHDFDSGLVGPVTFAAGRRIGARGAHVVTLDAGTGRFVPGPWVELPD